MKKLIGVLSLCLVLVCAGAAQATCSICSGPDHSPTELSNMEDAMHSAQSTAQNVDVDILTQAMEGAVEALEGVENSDYEEGCHVCCDVFYDFGWTAYTDAYTEYNSGFGWWTAAQLAHLQGDQAGPTNTRYHKYKQAYEAYLDCAIDYYQAAVLFESAEDFFNMTVFHVEEICEYEHGDE